METKKPEVPKDLGLEIVSPEEKRWRKVLKESKMLIENSLDNLEIQKGVKWLAETKLAAIKERHK